MELSWACFSSTAALEGLEAFTNRLRKDDDDVGMEGRAEPREGTASLGLEENPSPCLNRAAPPPLRVNSSYKAAAFSSSIFGGGALSVGEASGL